MGPNFVAPYRLSGKGGKIDAADAAAICDAVRRPNRRFVPIKSPEQQGQLMVHRARQGYVEARTIALNRIRGLPVMGARAVLNTAKDKTDSISRWATALAEWVGYWKAVVTIAAKNARTA